MNFIEQVAEYILDKEKENISNTKIIVPGKRIGVFLKKSIELNLSTANFFPEIISFQEWMEEMSSYTIPHPIRLQIESYNAYIQICKEEPESLQQFLKWSATLLNDFNEIDKNLVDSETILSNLKEFSSIDKWSNNLREDALIESKLSKTHKQFWTMASELYTQLQTNLKAKNWAYNGMFLRDIAENIHNQNANNQPIYIVGFNALSRAEEKIFDHFITKQQAQILWDIDKDLLQDESQETGHFIRKYATKWAEYLPNDFNWNSAYFSQEKKEYFISGLNGTIQQSEAASKVLEEIISKDTNLDSTAIVLCDEKALIPFLNRIPDDVDSVNITMGYSLSNTPVLSFVQILFELLNVKNNTYYFKSIEKLFNHPFLQSIKSTNLQEYCSKNRIWREDYLGWKQIFKKVHLEKYDFLFQEHIKSKDVLKIGYQLLYIIHKSGSSKLALEHEYIYTLQQVWHQCLDIQEEYGAYIDDPYVLKTFMESILRKENLDFIGTPIGGLQLMGMLETRLLDFKEIIFLGINEGVMPKGNTQDSLIPFDLKQYYNMTTFLEKDAIYAYHFFRLLQRVEKSYFIYDNNIESTGSGNKSRFLQQIEKEWTLNNAFNFNIKYTQFNIENKPKHISRQFPKSEQAKDVLLQKALNGLSASFINEYINCPLNFYKTRVLGLKNIENEEVINHAELGTAVHDSLEALYNQNKGVPLTREILIGYKKQAKSQILTEFKKLGNPKFLSQAQNKIRLKVGQEFIENMIQLDMNEVANGHTLEIIENEKECSIELIIPGIVQPIRIMGFIDRIDKLNDTIRIIDYKTGNVSSVNMDNFFEDFLNHREKDFSKQFQVMLYAYMVWKTEKYSDQDIQTGLISFRKFKSGFQTLKRNRKIYDPIPDMLQFENLLIQIIQEILLDNKVYEHPEAKERGCYYC